MTIQEIYVYLKRHHFLVFRYRSEYYTLRKNQTLLSPQYSLIATDTPPHHRNSLNELCEQVYISDSTFLIEAIKYIETPGWDDPSWESYEAVRHSVIVHRREVHFLYNQRYYWIAQTDDGTSHLSDDLGNTQGFNSCRDLFEDARIDGNTLKDIWEQVIVDAC